MIFLLVVLFSCTAKKEAAKFELLPDWVKQKPIISDCYVGVGSAKKIGTAAQYKQNARQDALADLASEVSTRVSSTSVLHSIETDYGIVENFNQRIEVSTSEYLEGFEPVDVYEDEDAYWIYFKVSKAEFQEKKMQKKQDALSAAVLKYEAGQKELNENKPRESLTFFLQGLAAITNYLSEDTKTDYKGSSIDIGNELYASVDFIVNGLSIKGEISEITIKRGSSYNGDLLFKVEFNERPAQAIPVNFISQVAI
ncbi:MAG: LPP20 family lipoprotein [Bacteroidales bacterium]